MSKILKYGAINITINPHKKKEQTYIDLFKTCFNEKVSANYYGDKNALIGKLRTKKNSLRGEIYTFDEIRMGDKWLNIKEFKTAEKSEIEGINIPSELKPHFKRFRFELFPKKHKIIFEWLTDDGHSLSARQAERVFNSLFAKETFSRFGDIQITIEPKKNVLQDIFKAEHIKNIEIHITKPNADFGVAEDILDFMSTTNSENFDLNLKGKKKEGLKLSKNVKAIANVAESNGYVEATVIDDNINKKISTKNEPLIFQEEYDSKKESNHELFKRVSKKMFRYLTK